MHESDFYRLHNPKIATKDVFTADESSKTKEA